MSDKDLDSSGSINKLSTGEIDRRIAELGVDIEFLNQQIIIEAKNYKPEHIQEVNEKLFSMNQNLEQLKIEFEKRKKKE